MPNSDRTGEYLMLLFLAMAFIGVATGGLTPRTSLQAVAEIAAFLRAM